MFVVVGSGFGKDGLVYVRPYHRISTYLVGIIAGYIIFATKGKLQMPRVTHSSSFFNYFD